MLQDITWTKAGQIFAMARPAGALFPIESAMDEIGRAARDIAFCEAAEAIALNRIDVLREMISACHAEIAVQDQEIAAELRATIEGLAEELASFEETLPLECAFRADQRDHASARIEAARDRLRAFTANPRQEAALFDPALSREEAVELAQAALARTPEAIILSARAEARARIAGAPIPTPEGSHYHFTQPEGWTAWLATRLAQRAGQALQGNSGRAAI